MIRVVAALLLLLFALVIASLTLGDVPLPWRALLETFSGATGAGSKDAIIILDLRLPRVLLSILVGMAHATAGTIALSIMRNPLAEPGVLGINSGAAAAVMAVVVLIQDPPAELLQAAGFFGAVLMAAAVYLLAWRGGTSSLRIILIGIGLSSLATAATTLMTAFGEIGDVARSMIWLAGSVYDATIVKVQHLALWIIAPLALAWAASRELDLVRTGDSCARSLGQPVDRVRGFMMILITIISGAAVAVSGLIGFVGLLAPHIARWLVGSSHARIFPVAALVGACLVVAADLTGRTIMAPAQLPAGIVTGLIGAPFFGFILWRRRHGHG